jgi:hypothetical protein
LRLCGNHSWYPGKILVAAYFVKACGNEQFQNRFLLIDSVFQQQPARFFQVVRRAIDDCAYCVQAVTAAGQSQRWFMRKITLCQV